MVPEVDSVAVNVEITAGLPVDVVNTNGVVKVLENAEGGVEGYVPAAVDLGGIEAVCPSLVLEDGIQIVNSFVEIPVKEVDTLVMADCVGKSSGKEIRNQNNWLIDSSSEEAYSEFSESDNDFTLERSSNATRGRGHRRI
ncbi:hypothetical protein MA16_Dca021990 [Dendrobium catenatum]|uniref:Uncharacterized protein n=1 Tax=Dendrobium catenatum TaxID=906689 RepID=A0A2I0X9U0_9ASPA|nr:hypothetical protein MA16_Dca021990 [Dendrobium catenatum]